MVKKHISRDFILINYTGKTIKVFLKEGDTRFNSIEGEFIILPSIGEPKINTIYHDKDSEMYCTLEYCISNMPNKMKGTYYIVRNNVARYIAGMRDDIMVLLNEREELTGNILNLNETQLIGDDLVKVLVNQKSF